MLFKLVNVFIFFVAISPDELRRIHPYTPRDRGTRTGIVAMGGGVMLRSGWMLPPGS